MGLPLKLRRLVSRRLHLTLVRYLAWHRLNDTGSLRFNFLKGESIVGLRFETAFEKAHGFIYECNNN